MSTPHVIYLAAGLVSLAAIAVVVWVVVSLVRDYRAERGADAAAARAAAERAAAARRTAGRLCRGEVDGDLAALVEGPTQPLGVAGRPGGRAAREIHHMTAAEFTRVNAEFADIIRASWPDLP